MTETADQMEALAELDETPAFKRIESPLLITLSDQQEEAVERILEWLDPLGPPHTDSEYRLGGYAGTGKTTVIRHLIEELSQTSGLSVAVCAFTGKACSVLRKKGVSASTIHSTIYQSSDADMRSWELKGSLPYDLIIVDEASMIPRDLYADLKSFEIPILFVGDPGQLEPVGDDPNLMAKCDFVLETIHRQAAESPIIQLADAVRKGAGIGAGFRHPQLATTYWPLANENLLLMADQILCGTNAVRRNWNGIVRRMKGFPDSSLVAAGEKIIVLRNNRRLGVFNGQHLLVREVLEEYPEGLEVRAEDDSGRAHSGLRLWRGGFEGKIPKGPGELPKQHVFADYGYVVTCHKAQGSEWDNVLVIDPGQIRDWDMARWRYTAITRASKALIYALQK